MKWWTTPWNPVLGCTPASPGCDNCYAKALHDQRHVAHIMQKEVPDCYAQPFERVQLMEERLKRPLHWRKPRQVFVNSMSDLFHEDVPFEFLDRVFAVMALAPQHTFMILTKRPEKAREYVSMLWTAGWVRRLQQALPEHFANHGISMRRSPVGNIWLGVTAENQEQADARIPVLLDTPAARRFVSVEPMLGPVDLRPYFSGNEWDCDCGWAGSSGETKTKCPNCYHAAFMPPINEDEEVQCPECKHVFYPDAESDCCPECDSTNGLCPCCVDNRPWWPAGLNWVISGGESGPNARPMHPDWARSLRDQCEAAGVPYFHKQNGEWQDGGDANFPELCVYRDGRSVEFTQEAILAEERRSGLKHNDSWSVLMSRVGSRRAGRLLDGREHNDIPLGGAS